MITVWLNYHSEGWQPRDFDSEAEAVAFITDGHNYQPIRITTDAALNELLIPPAKEEPK